MRRFTRLTNGFSKKIENHIHAIAIHYHALQLRSCSPIVAMHSSNGRRGQQDAVVN
jgi:hypothetical protein